jgi:hypothetical protein
MIIDWARISRMLAELGRTLVRSSASFASPTRAETTFRAKHSLSPELY